MISKEVAQLKDGTFGYDRGMVERAKRFLQHIQAERFLTERCLRGVFSPFIIHFTGAKEPIKLALAS
jgi:hypothetical protein